MKKPWLAALLNVIPLGPGYLYLGRGGRCIANFVGALILGALGLVMLLVFGCGFGEECGAGQITAILAAAWVPMLLLVLYSVWDGWRLARRHNEELSSQQGGAGTAQGAGK